MPPKQLKMNIKERKLKTTMRWNLTLHSVHTSTTNKHDRLLFALSDAEQLEWIVLAVSFSASSPCKVVVSHIFEQERSEKEPHVFTSHFRVASSPRSALNGMLADPFTILRHFSENRGPNRSVPPYYGPVPMRWRLRDLFFTCCLPSLFLSIFRNSCFGQSVCSVLTKVLSAFSPCSKFIFCKMCFIFEYSHFINAQRWRMTDTQNIIIKIRTRQSIRNHFHRF